jgi:hypothetical protein
MHWTFQPSTEPFVCTRIQLKPEPDPAAKGTGAPSEAPLTMAFWNAIKRAIVGAIAPFPGANIAMADAVAEVYAEFGITLVHAD